MPRDKTETHNKILPAAMEVFLEKGYEKATMREIAAKAGITAAGLYRHFPDKEAMFSALVEPVMKKLEKWYQYNKKLDYEYLENNDMDGMWQEETDLKMMIDLVYENFQEFKLILCCSEGTRYVNFLHDFTMVEQEETMAYMDAARERGVPVRNVNSEGLHLLMSAYVNAMFEVVIHDYSREQASHYLKTLRDFFSPGWRNLLGL